MSVALDAVSRSGDGYTSALTWSHTVGSASDRYLEVYATVRSSADKVTGATYNGVAMTRTDYVNNGAFGIYKYGLVAPASGAHNVVISTWSANPIDGGAQSFSGIDQTTPVAASSNAQNGFGSSPFTPSAITIPSGGVGTSYISSLDDKTNAFVVGGSATQSLQSDIGLDLVAMSYRLGSGTTMPWSWSGSNTKNVGELVSGLNGLAAGNTPPTFPGPNVSNIAATQSVAITPVDIHTDFADTDTITFSASPAGTAWPTGLTINSTTGVISGTIATVATTTGLKVRATDTAAQTVDSNSFNVTVSATAPRTVSLRLTSDGTTPRASLTGLKWAWWDVATPNLITTAPTDKGSAGATDSSGDITLSLPGSALSIGGTGYLVITNSNGVATQTPAPWAFNGPRRRRLTMTSRLHLLFIWRLTRQILLFADTSVLRLLAAGASTVQGLELVLGPPVFERPAFRLMAQLTGLPIGWAHLGDWVTPQVAWGIGFLCFAAAAFWRIYEGKPRMAWGVTVSLFGFALWFGSTLAIALALGDFGVPTMALAWVFSVHLLLVAIRTGLNDDSATP